ncbi:hypothetical protein LINPERPRIM_LOCUS29998 [Linum perenne]
MFFKILAHSNSARDNAKDFQHSATTVSKYVGIVLKAVISLSHIVCTQDCVGAIDGVHVDAIIPTSQQTPFCGRKGTTTQNVLCVCSFDMRYTYVVAVWEGSSHDARILSSTTTDRNSQFPMPPLGMITIDIILCKLSLYEFAHYLLFSWYH